MSARTVARALARLNATQATLAPVPGGGSYGVFVHADRRRRPVMRLSTAEVEELSAAGSIQPALGSDAFVLSDAGRARVRREAAEADEAFLAQHAAIEPRSVMDGDGVARMVRGMDGAAALKRLAALRDANGAPWLSAAEIAAASRLHQDWCAGQAGLVRGSDWSAAPRGGAARGPGNAQEAALARRCDAGQRMNEALDSLAPQLRRVVEQVCLHEHGLEALERREGWPARSGKIALKLGLAQLAASPAYRGR